MLDASVPEPIPCPICGKPAATPRLRPFCSPRCAEVDLGRWFTGAYAVPVDAPEEDGSDPEAE